MTQKWQVCRTVTDFLCFYLILKEIFEQQFNIRPVIFGGFHRPEINP